MPRMSKDGIIAATVAYAVWGVLPAYWKAVQHVPSAEILGHRTVWAFVLLVVVLLIRRNWSWLGQARKSPRTLVTFAVTSGLLGLNWGIYIWAVNAGHIVDTSLGYFINPLITVAFGVIFLRERLRLWQGVAIGLASVGVIYLTVGYGSFPWIALTLASTFGLYGLLRKTAALEALEGLALEMSFLFLPMLGYLVYLASAGKASFGHTGVGTGLLLALSGVVTAGPLFLFNYGARRIPLTMLGMLHYLAPTGQFLLGVLAYGEDFSTTRLIGFSVVWTALLIFSLESFVEDRRRRARAAEPV
jgi:chloramphenicol-sensitive protein RarD